MSIFHPGLQVIFRGNWNFKILWAGEKPGTWRIWPRGCGMETDDSWRNVPESELTPAYLEYEKRAGA
jgi:hypothetical protein